MTDKEKIRKEVEKLKAQLIRGACSSQIAMETRCKEEAYNEVLAILDSLQEEPVSEGRDIFDNCLKSEEKFILPQKISGNIDCENCLYSSACALGDIQACIVDKPVSEDLEKAAGNYAFTMSGEDEVSKYYAFKAGAKWQRENLWKPADGDDLPEIDREVVVLVKYSTQRNIHDKEYTTYRVGFGHRPNPNGWDGRNIDTNEVTHYTPKLYDKGGWNVPDIAYWLDVELPKEIE